MKSAETSHGLTYIIIFISDLCLQLTISRTWNLSFIQLTCDHKITRYEHALLWFSNWLCRHPCLLFCWLLLGFRLTLIMFILPIPITQKPKQIFVWEWLVELHWVWHYLRSMIVNGRIGVLWLINRSINWLSDCRVQLLSARLWTFPVRKLSPAIVVQWTWIVDAECCPSSSSSSSSAS